jgi:hypothetical protein
MNWITAVNIPLAASYFGIGLILPSPPCFPSGRFGFPTSGLDTFVVVNVRDMPSLLYVQVNVHRDNLRINNQQDTSSIQNFICHETLHVSGIYCAHHQELSAVHVAIGMFHAGYVTAA